MLSLYFSKQNLGISYYDKINTTIQCSQINNIIYRTSQLIQQLIKTQNIISIITNNDKHQYFDKIFNFSHTYPNGNVNCQILKIIQTNLSDQVIENNLNLLRFNPLKNTHNNKKTYIRQMLQQSQLLSLQKQKIKSLSSLLQHLFSQDSYKLCKLLYIEEIQFHCDKLLNSVIITQKQYQELQIIKQQIHPSFIKGKGRSKQGFSILNLFEVTLYTNYAKKILKNIFKNPTNNIQILSQRSNTIDWILTFIVSSGTDFKKIFKTIHSIQNILKKFKHSRAEFEDWRKLSKTLEGMLFLCKTLMQKTRINETQQIPSLIKSYISLVNWNQLSELLNLIIKTLDLTSFGIKRGIDLRLDQLKKIYDNLPHLLTIYAKQQNWNKSFRIIFMAQIGYLVRVPLQINELYEICEQQEWCLQFSNSSGRYYSNGLTEMLDQQYGDIYGEITDRQKKICFDIETRICQAVDTIQYAFWVTSEIQCLWGISIISKGMSRPRISSQTSFIIVEGWHILLAQDAIDNNGFSFDHDDKAPVNRVYNSENNIVNTNYSNRLIVVSGPNASGKSIYLKQTAIIIYLAHIGVFVPARLAQIPLIDKIVLVSCSKSIYQQVNGFQGQVKSLSRVITPGVISNRSLVLIDELGASTDVQLAMQIFATTISYLSNNEENNTISQHSISDHQKDISPIKQKFKIPISILVTHLTQIIFSNLIKQNYYIRSLTMQMEKQRICLYKIAPGLAKKGYGIDCAKSIMGYQYIEKAKGYWKEIIGQNYDY